MKAEKPNVVNEQIRVAFVLAVHGNCIGVRKYAENRKAVGEQACSKDFSFFGNGDSVYNLSKIYFFIYQSIIFYT